MVQLLSLVVDAALKDKKDLEKALSRVAALDKELAALRASAQKPNDLEVLSLCPASVPVTSS